MTEYQQQDGNGILFKNERKQQDNSPDYSGTVTVDGKQRRIAGWIKTGQSGKRFMSLAVSELKQQERPAQPSNVAPGVEPFEDDSIPF